MGKKKSSSPNTSSARAKERRTISLESKKEKLKQSQEKLALTQKTLELKENRENITKFKLQKREEEQELSGNHAAESQQSLLLKFPGYAEHFENYVTKRSKALLEKMPAYNAEYMKGK